MQDMKMMDQVAGHKNARHEIVGLVSFLSIWVGPGAKKKRPTTAE